MPRIASEEHRRSSGFQRFQSFLGKQPATWKMKLNRPTQQVVLHSGGFVAFSSKSRKKTSSKPAPLTYPETVLHIGKKEKHSSYTQIKSEFSLLDARSHVPEQFLNAAVMRTPQLHQASRVAWQLQADVPAPQGFVCNPASSCLTTAFSSWLVYYLQSKGFQLYCFFLFCFVFY